MVNECSWYCEGCNESFCEHCDKGEEVNENLYCDECAERQKTKPNGGDS